VCGKAGRRSWSGLASKWQASCWGSEATPVLPVVGVGVVGLVRVASGWGTVVGLSGLVEALTVVGVGSGVG